MRSSELVRELWRRPLLALLCLVALTGCEALPAAGVTTCTAAGPTPINSAPGSDGLAPRPGARPLRCGTASSPGALLRDPLEADGQSTLAYRLRDGGSFEATRTPHRVRRAERALSPAGPTILALLVRVGAQCVRRRRLRIDWQHVETQPDDARAVSSNRSTAGRCATARPACRRDAAGQVQGLLLRSACWLIRGAFPAFSCNR